MGLTFKEKRSKLTAEFLRAGGIKARVNTKDNSINVKTLRGLKLAKNNIFVKKFKIKINKK